MDEYEQNYHTKLHGHLYSNENYYKIRAKLAISKYFRGISKKSKVLEYGCGLGQNIYRLPNAQGYDISKFSLNFAKNKGIKTISNFDSIKDESYDVIFSSHVFEHIENPFETLKQLLKKLKKGGKLILILPVEKQKKADYKLDDSQHIYCWNFRTINNLLIKTGFKPVLNSYLRGTGYKRLLPIAKINFQIYKFLTGFFALLFGLKEMKIIAIKK